MTIKAGKCWELDVKVVAIARCPIDDRTEIVTFNFNNGAIICAETFDDTILRGWYDGYGGPKAKFSQLYIWNSTKLNQNGKPKTTFTVSPIQLKEVIQEYKMRRKLKEMLKN